MGKQLSKLRFITRPLKNYNVEDRAFKVISREKPTPAPPYPSMEKIMKDINNDPEILNKGRLTEEQLKKLSQVYVTSHGDNPIVKRREKDLPVDRHTHDDHMYGYHEPARIPFGKLSLRQVIEVIEKHATDPLTHTPERIAADYKLEPDVARDILTYFRAFKIHIPPRPEEAKGMEKVREVIKKPFYLDMKKDAKKNAGR